MHDKRTDGEGTSLADQFKRHWFVSILLLCCAVAVATWGLAYQLLVSPRDFEIHKLEREVAEKNTQPQTGTIPNIVLPRTWVPEGGSVTTKDGSCLIHVDYIGLIDVGLSVTVGAEQPQKFKNVASGTRLSIQTQGTVYYVDIHEINQTNPKDKQVGIEVARQSTPKPTQK